MALTPPSRALQEVFQASLDYSDAEARLLEAQKARAIELLLQTNDDQPDFDEASAFAALDSMCAEARLVVPRVLSEVRVMGYILNRLTPDFQTEI